MVGPSSSHTAGAVHLGLIARALAPARPVKAVVGLAGSFARTGKGHGTDKAILAGLLGIQPDDVRIRDSWELARQAGLEAEFQQLDLPGSHPNTAVIELVSDDGRTTTVRGASTGGGRILIESVNNLAVAFKGDYPTLLVSHLDAPGLISAVTSLLSGQAINIASMKVFRSRRGGVAIMVIETDQPVCASLREQINEVAGIFQVSLIMPALL